MHKKGLNQNNQILVIGSLNTDVVIRTGKFPKKGETLFCEPYKLFPGGKGANQAVAVSRLNGKTAFAGKVGKDSLADFLLRNLKTNQIDTKHIGVSKTHPTGLAFITVYPDGDNSIFVSPSANMDLNKQDIRKLLPVIKASKIMLMQLEIPLDTIEYAIKLAKENGLKVVLDAGPARKLKKDIFKHIDILSPNETEAEALTGIKVKDTASAKKAANILLGFGAKCVILKLGEKGALVVDKNSAELIPSIKVKAIDTTAAGDAFMGGLCVALAENKPLKEAVRFGNICGALTATKLGAQTSLPFRSEVEKILLFS